MRNALALAAGLLMAALLLAVAEVIARYRYPAGLELPSTTYVEPSESLGWAPVAGVRTRVEKQRGGRVIYSVVYTFDERGRRVVPQDPAGTYRRFALFFGCSSTFGEGLNDDETLPARLAARLPAVRAYNYAFRGWGPQHLLARLESTDLQAEVAEPEGWAIYNFPAFHLRRVIGSSDVLAWAQNLPYYHLQNGALVRDGFIQTTFPVYAALLKVFGSSRLVQTLKISWPPRISRADRILTCRILARSRDLLRAQFDRIHFVVLLSPTDPSDDIRFCLDEMGVAYLDYRTAFRGIPQEQLRIPYDGHISARGNQILADLLARDLPARFPEEAISRAGAGAVR